MGGKVEFGASNEDAEGPTPERISAMIRFIHRKMEGDKFDEERCETASFSRSCFTGFHFGTMVQEFFLILFVVPLLI
jgi:hypothetical protein